MSYPNLKVSTVVRALKPLDPEGANVQPGEFGVVVEAAKPDYVYDWTSGKPEPVRVLQWYGPLVRWLKGARCNIYDGQVEVTEIKLNQDDPKQTGGAGA